MTEANESLTLLSYHANNTALGTFQNCKGVTNEMNILSVAHAVPSRIVTNRELIDTILDKSREHLAPRELSKLETDLRGLFQQIGAETRHLRSPGECAVDFGIAAAEDALRKANVTPLEVDLLIYAGVGRGFLEPATANVFHEALGLKRATCFDILDACASWLRALDVAVHFMSDDVYRNVLIINCEFNFQQYFPQVDSIGRFRELAAGFTIGEAATATLVSCDKGVNEYYATFRNNGAGNSLCQIPLPHAETFLNGSAKPMWRPLEFYAQSARLHKMAINALNEQYWSDEHFVESRYDIIFGHAAGLPATRKVAQKLRLDEKKHYEIFPNYGNTVSASLPLAMSLALEAGEFERGDRALFVVGSAGVSSVLCLLEY